MGPISSSTSRSPATPASVLSNGRYAAAAGATESARRVKLRNVLILVVLLLTATPAIQLPGGEGGIGLDDLQYAPLARKLLVPAGRTGKLDLIDPATSAIVAIEGFTHSDPGKGHGAGATSADEGPAGVVFATDRDTRRVMAVDLAKHEVVASAALAAGPDYVRWIAAIGEVWVTEPRAKR